MKILRSILAFLREPLLVPVVAGFVVSVLVIIAVESLNSMIHPPPGEGPLMERVEALQKDQEAMKAWIDSLPISAMFALVVGWQAGAFLGGAVSALLAGRAPLLHAGIIGALVLTGTIVNLFNMKQQLGYSHPDWVLVVALVLPLPMSLLAGKLVSMLFPASAPSSAEK